MQLTYALVKTVLKYITNCHYEFTVVASTIMQTEEFEGKQVPLFFQKFLFKCSLHNVKCHVCRYASCFISGKLLI
jgi:hypothetical protein